MLRTFRASSGAGKTRTLPVAGRAVGVTRWLRVLVQVVAIAVLVVAPFAVMIWLDASGHFLPAP
jgi:hypothetical protein